jgi:hypothetical protein
MTEEREDEPSIEPQDENDVPQVEEPGDFGDAAEGEIDAAALLSAAEDDQLRARASWHLLPREMFSFAFANCLFFAGAVSAWARDIPPDWARAWNAANPKAVKLVVQDLDPSTYISGLDTIRGTIIFALALYGFLQIFFNLFGRTIKVWPYVVTALLALEVGISGIMAGKSGIGWEAAGAYLDGAESKTMFDDFFLTWSAIAPAYWALTLGGVVVLIVALSGIMKGAQSAKASAGEESGRRRR